VEKVECQKESLALKHEFLLEKYKFCMTFIIGIFTGFTLTTYGNPSLYIYVMFAGIVGIAAWIIFGIPITDAINETQEKVSQLAK
jgi:hypothetical protein